MTRLEEEGIRLREKIAGARLDWDARERAITHTRYIADSGN